MSSRSGRAIAAEFNMAVRLVTNFRFTRQQGRALN